MGTKETLIAARALLPDEAHWSNGTGHHDGYGSRSRGTVCMAGACYAAAHGWDMDTDCPKLGTSNDPAIRALAAAIGGSDEGDISDFNDDPERTLAQVHAAFDRAIESS